MGDSSVLDRWVNAVARFDRRALSEVPTDHNDPVAGMAGRLSHFASHGVLWLAVSGGRLVVARSRERRTRVAVGLTAYAIAHVLGDLVKAAFDRRRPPSHDDDQPTSSSMPSTHSAGAVAYAIAGADGGSASDVFIAALAVLVTSGRLTRRRHYPSDVGVGVVIGVLAGALARRLTPRLQP